jgi:hypothetical protein
MASYTRAVNTPAQWRKALGGGLAAFLVRWPEMFAGCMNSPEAGAFKTTQGQPIDADFSKIWGVPPRMSLPPCNTFHVRFGKCLGGSKKVLPNPENRAG